MFCADIDALEESVPEPSVSEPSNRSDEEEKMMKKGAKEKRRQDYLLAL